MSNSSKKRQRPGLRVHVNVTSVKPVEEITILSSDEDCAPTPPKHSGSSTSKTRNEFPFVSKEVEDKLLADDDILPLERPPPPKRCKSPSLLGKGISHLLEADMTEETTLPCAPVNKDSSSKGAETSPVAVLESQPEDDEIEPVISLNNLGNGTGEGEEKMDPVGSPATATTDTRPAEADKDLEGTAVSKPNDVEKPETEVMGVSAVITSATSDAVPSTSRGTAQTLPAANGTELKKTDIKESVSASKELNKFLEEFEKKTKPDKEFKSKLVVVEAKMWKAFDLIQIKDCSSEFRQKVADKIRQFAQSMAQCSKPCVVAFDLLEYLKSIKGGPKKQQKREEYITKLEAKLKVIEAKIEEYDLQDRWDSDGEENSSYLTKDRLVAQYVMRFISTGMIILFGFLLFRFMKHFELLCKVNNSDTLTDRPTQKKISTKGITGHEEINAAVELYVNNKISKALSKCKGKKGQIDVGLAIPDYPEILKVTKDTCKRKSLYLDEMEIKRAAQTLFEHIVRVIKKRRRKDLEDALPVNPNKIEDPASNDPELERKLRENETKRSSEAEILKEFTQRQVALKEEAKEVPEDEDIENSPPGSDAEDEEESADGTEDDASGFIDDENVGDIGEKGLPQEVVLISDSEDDVEGNDFNDKEEAVEGVKAKD